MKLTRKDMTVQRKQGEVERHVGYARVGFENCKKAKQHDYDEERLSPHPDSQSTNVACKMQPKDAEKELSE